MLVYLTHLTRFAQIHFMVTKRIHLLAVPLTTSPLTKLFQHSRALGRKALMHVVLFRYSNSIVIHFHYSLLFSIRYSLNYQYITFFP